MLFWNHLASSYRWQCELAWTCQLAILMNLAFILAACQFFWLQVWLDSGVQMESQQFFYLHCSVLPTYAWYHPQIGCSSWWGWLPDFHSSEFMKSVKEWVLGCPGQDSEKRDMLYRVFLEMNCCVLNSLSFSLEENPFHATRVRNGCFIKRFVGEREFQSVQLLSLVQLFEAPWTAARQASLSITNPWSLLKLLSIELVMPSNHLILRRPLLTLSQHSIFPSIRVFSSESALRISWPKYWSFSICPSHGYSGLISFRIDWFDIICWNLIP